MPPRKAEVIDRESRWARPVAAATFTAIALVVIAIIIGNQGIGGTGGDSEVLRQVDAHRAGQLVSSILQAIGLALLAAPLYYLFRAAQARRDAVRNQLVGVVIAGPLFLGVLAILSGVTILHAAGQFVTHEVPRLTAQGTGLDGRAANEAASKLITNAPLRPLETIFGIAGPIAFAIGMFYTALQAMRAGLLTRFWGALGVALGAVSIIPFFFEFTLLWYVYLGLLIAGWLPGGRPPAWAVGEAIPWPSPGQRVAAELGHAEVPEVPAEPAADGGEAEGGQPSPRRKRKQRT